MLVGDRLGEDPGEAIWLAAGVRDALGPGPAIAEPARIRFELGHEPRLAHPGVADHQDGRSDAALRCPRQDPAQSCRFSGSARRAGPTDGVRRAPARPTSTVSPSAYRWTGLDWPRRTTVPRSVDRQPIATAPDSRLVEQDLAGPGDRLDPGRGRDASPVTDSRRSRARSAATTSPVARPIRTSHPLAAVLAARAGRPGSRGPPSRPERRRRRGRPASRRPRTRRRR